MAITQELIKHLYDYDQDNGGLRRKVSVSRNTKRGDVVGRVTSGKYHSTTIKGKEFQIHRLVWLWHYGDLPDFIDHKDGDPENNRIENLREATNSQNQYNKRMQKNNSSGYKNVYRKGDKWSVQFRIEKKLKYFGAFEDILDADYAARCLRKVFHGEFARDY